MRYLFSFMILLWFLMTDSLAQVRTGADCTESYFPLLEYKRVALVINHTSVIRNEDKLVPLPDSLLRAGIEITSIMAPEHGYKGIIDPGEHFDGGVDPSSNIVIHSLYGNNKKPRREWLDDADVVVFDLQDVGTRFYTYLSTLYYVIEACGETGTPLIVLDRPNPNDTIDGPLLQPEFKSFVGMLPIPVLHGSTLGELARMMIGEKWVKFPSEKTFPIIAGRNSVQIISSDSLLTVIPCQRWRHGQRYSLPVAPSPNLPNDQAVALYPSLCLFEATNVSVGRGTDFAFQCYGLPAWSEKETSFSFTPKPNRGNQHPLQEDRLCRGFDLREDSPLCPKEIAAGYHLGFSLKYYQKAYELLGPGWCIKHDFFYKLAGQRELLYHINGGMSENKIKQTWQKDLMRYRQMRQQYTIYK